MQGVAVYFTETPVVNTPYTVQHKEETHTQNREEICQPRPENKWNNYMPPSPKQNIILGIDFTRNNCAVVTWTEDGTRILSVADQDAIEVKEDELGTPVTARRNVTVSPRTGGIFHIDINATFDSNQIITPHRPYFENSSTVYPHEIVISLTEKEETFMHVMHITNVSENKWCHVKKGHSRVRETRVWRSTVYPCSWTQYRNQNSNYKSSPEIAYLKMQR